MEPRVLAPFERQPARTLHKQGIKDSEKKLKEIQMCLNSSNSEAKDG